MNAITRSDFEQSIVDAVRIKAAQLNRIILDAKAVGIAVNFGMEADGDCTMLTRITVRRIMPDGRPGEKL